VFFADARGWGFQPRAHRCRHGTPKSLKKWAMSRQRWIKVTASSGDTVYVFVDHIMAIVETERGSSIILREFSDGIPVLQYPEILLALISEASDDRRDRSRR
jgi:hypothetical protein